MTPNAIDIPSSSREFFHGKDNTVSHKGFPICYRLKNGHPASVFLRPIMRARIRCLFALLDEAAKRVLGSNTCNMSGLRFLLSDEHDIAEGNIQLGEIVAEPQSW